MLGVVVAAVVVVDAVVGGDVYDVHGKVVGRWGTHARFLIYNLFIITNIINMY